MSARADAAAATRARAPRLRTGARPNLHDAGHGGEEDAVALIRAVAAQEARLGIDGLLAAAGAWARAHARKRRRLGGQQGAARVRAAGCRAARAPPPCARARPCADPGPARPAGAGAAAQRAPYAAPPTEGRLNRAAHGGMRQAHLSGRHQLHRAPPAPPVSQVLQHPEVRGGNLRIPTMGGGKHCFLSSKVVKSIISRSRYPRRRPGCREAAFAAVRDV